jgi:hypothetical protein
MADEVFHLIRNLFEVEKTSDLIGIFRLPLPNFGFRQGRLATL